MSEASYLNRAYITEVMHGIIQQDGLPILYNKGFAASPFLENWHGKDNLGDYVVSLFRISTKDELEYLDINVSHFNRRIVLHINVFELNPRIKTLNELNGHTIIPLCLAPYSISRMVIGKDEFGKIPLFRIFSEVNLDFGAPRSKVDLSLRRKRLTNSVIKVCTNIDDSFLRWHKRYTAASVDWKMALRA